MYSIVMAGGTGTRFWPLSRRDRPKQLLPFPTTRPMLAETLLRLQTLSPPDRTLVITSSSLVDEVARIAPALPRANIVGEPVGRNTAPCIGLACHLIKARTGENPVVGVFAADHFVADGPAFIAAVNKAAKAASEPGVIVTLGIRPTRPETGYGYIRVEPDSGSPPRVARFVEKPDVETARAYLESGRYLWNAGIFLFRVDTMLAELDRQLPELSRGLSAIAEGDGQEAIDRVFPGLPSVSIDYGVMEGAASVRVVPTDCGWSDLGHWAALGEVMERDEGGNVVRGEAIVLDSTRVVVVNGRDDHLVAALGLEDIVVVTTKDATLVLPAKRSQDVRRIVELLEQGRQDLL